MVLDYNKLLVKRSNIVVYNSLQSPSAPPRVSLLHSYTFPHAVIEFPARSSGPRLSSVIHVVSHFFRPFSSLSFSYWIDSKEKQVEFLVSTFVQQSRHHRFHRILDLWSVDRRADANKLVTYKKKLASRRSPRRDRSTRSCEKLRFHHLQIICFSLPSLSAPPLSFRTYTHARTFVLSIPKISLAKSTTRRYSRIRRTPTLCVVSFSHSLPSIRLVFVCSCVRVSVCHSLMNT